MLSEGQRKMIRKPLISKNNCLTGQVFDFVEFQKKKPFFRKPMKITVGHPINQTYIMVKNILYKEKQILFLEQEKDAGTIVLVEAKLKDGKLHSISKLSQESIKDVMRLK
jgi:uncharacterized protein (DUF1919 family)